MNKQLIVLIGIVFLAGTAGWISSFFYYRSVVAVTHADLLKEIQRYDAVFKMSGGGRTEFSIEDFKKVKRQAAIEAHPNFTPNQDLQLGVANMAYRHAVRVKEKGWLDANASCASVSSGHFSIFTNHTWGGNQWMSDEIRVALNQYPER